MQFFSAVVPLWLNYKLPVLLFLCDWTTNCQCCCSSVIELQTTSADVPLWLNYKLPVMMFLCDWTTNCQCCCSSVIELQTASAAVPLWLNYKLLVLLFLCDWTTNYQWCCSSVIELQTTSAAVPLWLNYVKKWLGFWVLFNLCIRQFTVHMIDLSNPELLTVQLIFGSESWTEQRVSNTALPK